MSQYPLIWPCELDDSVVEAALKEAAHLVVSVMGMDDNHPGLGHRHIYERQRGVMIAAAEGGKESIPNIFAIAEHLERKIGFRFRPEKSSIRDQRPYMNWPKLGWHQDFAGMALDPGQEARVAWVPLEDIDGTRPSLEVIAAEAKPMAHVRDDARFLQLDFHHDDFEGTVLKDLKAGTAVVFTPYTLHRTYFDNNMTNTRCSLDLRFYQ